jgi:hypothetical protein
MPEDNISEQDLYDLILRRLRDAHAEQLANDIVQVVRRGTVMRGDEGSGEGKTKALRPMGPREALAVALEFLITALQIPLMVNQATDTLGCQRIAWNLDGPPDLDEQSQHLNEAWKEALPFVDTEDHAQEARELRENVAREIDQSSEGTEKSSLMPIPSDLDLTAFQHALKAVINLKEELGFRFPEAV